MSAKTNPKPRTHYGTDAERAAYTGPLAPGDKYVTESGVYGWDGTAWRGGGGGGSAGGVPFLVGPNGSGAPYSSINTAQNAAIAAGFRTVYILPGNYAESFTLQANMELYGLGETPSVLLTGTVSVNGVNGTNSLKNIKVAGVVSFRTNTGGPTTATLQFNRVQVAAPAASIAFLVSDSTGLTIEATDSDFTGATNPGFSTNVSATMTAKRCTFTGDATNPGLIAAGGTYTLIDSEVMGTPIRSITAVTVFNFTNVKFTYQGTFTPAYDVFAGSTVNVHGWVEHVNLAANAAYFPGAATATASVGSNIGSFQLANLPTANNGALALGNNVRIGAEGGGAGTGSLVQFKAAGPAGAGWYIPGLAVLATA